MKKSILFSLCCMGLGLGLRAQVTQLNDNNSLQVTIPLSSTKTIVISQIDKSIWVTDATTMAGTFKISPDIKFEDDWALIPGKVIFKGSTTATGSEIYISDGTIAGTKIISDIVTGAVGSEPDNMVFMNGFVYFTADRPAEGRELWRSDGTPGNTDIVKDIFPGTGSSNTVNGYHLTSNGTYLLFAANSPLSGVELWKSDGTEDGTILLKEINTLTASSNPNSFVPFNNNTVLFLATDADHDEELWKTDGTPGGTILLKDINPVAGDSSKPRSFIRYNNMMLFLARTAANGEELWKTDATIDGTELVKDINPGPSNSTTVSFFGFDFPLFFGFHTFNNRVYFNATNGTSRGQIWSTDGTEANTVLLKDILSTVVFPAVANVSLLTAINLPTKFIFSVTDAKDHFELWESNGTPAGTKLFKAFAASDVPYVLVNFSFDANTGAQTYPLFKGTKFFFVAKSAAKGRELWISDGVDSTAAHTSIVKDINLNAGNGIPAFTFSLYTSTHLFFVANDGAKGNELWKTDGTETGTTMVEDINPNAASSNPTFLLLLNGKVIFNATDGDNANEDLFVVDGNFTPLPVKLTEFTVRLKEQDALLHWSTANEVNSKEFTIQRSYNGRDFEDIGTVPASNTSSIKHDYSFTDADISNSGRSIIYYRIIASDKNGKSETTNVIFIKLKNNSDWAVKLLANPVRSAAYLMLTGVTKEVHISIKDVSGKVYYATSRQNENGQITLPVANLAHGIYFIVAESNNAIKSIRFMKQ